MNLAPSRVARFLVASLSLAASAAANESSVPALAASVPVDRVPLVLGAPPAWVVMALGLAVVSGTLLRRSRKPTVGTRR